MQSGSVGSCAKASIFDHLHYAEVIHYSLASLDRRIDLIICLRNEASSSMLALSFGNYIEL